jgi:hypothetical protein
VCADVGFVAPGHVWYLRLKNLPDSGCANIPVAGPLSPKPRAATLAN